MTEPPAATSNNRFSLFLAGASVVLAILVVALGIQNHRLKQQLADEHAESPVLERGASLEPVRLVDPDGQPGTMADASDGARTLWLFFTPTCPACRSTLPVWSDLARSLEPDAPRVLGVNLARPGSPGNEELVTVDLGFPVYGIDHEASSGLSRITHVPATVILDADGRVERAWFGQLDDGLLAELLAALER